MIGIKEKTDIDYLFNTYLKNGLKRLGYLINEKEENCTKRVSTNKKGLYLSIDHVVDLSMLDNGTIGTFVVFTYTKDDRDNPIVRSLTKGLDKLMPRPPFLKSKPFALYDKKHEYTPWRRVINITGWGTQDCDDLLQFCRDLWKFINKTGSLFSKSKTGFVKL